VNAAARREAWVEGIGFWAPRLAGWPIAREVFRGAATAPVDAAPRPAPALLAPTERRRAPDSVAVALEVAMQACQAAARDPRTLPSVFASTHGDLAITDYTCSTLAAAPTQLSPTKFHNSVHNAAAGYWSIGAGSTAPYTALAADSRTFAQGLLETLVQVESEREPALLVAYDIEARGPVALVSPSTGLLGLSLVLSPVATGRSRLRLVWDIGGAADITPRRCNEAAIPAGNAMASGLPLFEALAEESASIVVLSLGRDLTLQLRIAP